MSLAAGPGFELRRSGMFLKNDMKDFNDGWITMESECTESEYTKSEETGQGREQEGGKEREGALQKSVVYF